MSDSNADNVVNIYTLELGPFSSLSDLHSELSNHEATFAIALWESNFEAVQSVSHSIVHLDDGLHVSVVTATVELLEYGGSGRERSASVRQTPASPSGSPPLRRTGAALRAELFVRDVSKSLAFYRLLGFETGDVDVDEPYAFVRRDGVRFGLCRTTSDVDASSRSVPTGTELVIEVDDIDAEWAAAVSVGVTIAEPIRDRPWGLRDFRVTDTDGYYLRFTSKGH
ncbi:bleomycin resistance protein [Rhodococcus sp. NBC_00297]|uniref:bleomycin resistance protein n=1 Tax=Rhodococcus sp. NBC_00297 TaxID=2976005 RepID=UPI002E29D7DA|nr:VOC family protein [Rhodococcus sp. NBC_00297]